MGKDFDMNKEQLDVRLDALLSAIQILSFVKEMKPSNMDHTERLALDFIKKSILPRMEKEKMKIIHAQTQIRVRLADDINLNLDQFIKTQGNTKELKSYICYLILNDYLRRKDNKVTIEDEGIKNEPVTKQDDFEDDSIEEMETVTDGDNINEESSSLPDKDDDMGKKSDDEQNNLGPEISELIIIDGPIDDNSPEVYSDDKNITTEVLKRFYNYLLNSPINSDAEKFYEFIKEIYQYYYLDIKESFSNVKTKGELLDAYEHFNNYSAINYLTTRHKSELKEAFKLFFFYLLKIDLENISYNSEFTIKIRKDNE